MTFVNTPTGNIDSNDLTQTLPSRVFRDAWRLNGTVIDLDRPVCELIVAERIRSAMGVRIKQGVSWKNIPIDTPNPVRITASMRLFLENTQASIGHPIHPRPNVHNGILFQDGVEFPIDDAGIVELAVFAYSWGLKISQTAQILIDGFGSLTDLQLTSFDTATIDWTITFDAADIANGWNDDILTQTP